MRTADSYYPDHHNPPSHHSILLWIFYLGMCILLCSGCDQLKAQKESAAGKDALLECDFENAYLHFRKADEYYPNHHEILIGLAISETIYFFDTPNMKDLLSKMGFQFTVQSLCQKLKEDDRNEDSAQPESCHTIDYSNLAHSFSKTDILSTEGYHSTAIDPDLTWHDIVVTLNTRNSLLKSAAEHAFAAAKTNDPNYHIGNVFGYDITVHAAELGILSMVASLLSTVIEIAEQYRWDFSVQKTVKALETKDYSWLVQAINNEFLHRKNTSSFPTCLPEIQQTIAALGFVVPLLKELKESEPQFDDHHCPVQKSLLHWENLHYGILSDLEKASHILDDSQTTASLNELFDPTTSFDILCALQNLPNLTIPVAKLYHSQWEWHFEEFQSQLNFCFTPKILDEQSPSFQCNDTFSFRLNSAWLNWNPKELL
ncbi:MAG: hypothetical protein J6A01_07370 [Proteobacteria bacterium]|nr:hypothetical protein [Pseudomonadota bacterium]